MRSIHDVIRSYPQANCPARPVPSYTGTLEQTGRIGLAVESMKRHMTNEGWELFAGLESAGYTLYGHGLPHNSTYIPTILASHPNLSTLVMQDKREWDVTPGRREYREVNARFREVEVLRARRDIFKLTIIKDAHQRQDYHRQSADEIGCHAWITYYHPTIICHLAPYVRPQHLLRIFHTVNPPDIPAYTHTDRQGAIISGAVNRNTYPLRTTIIRSLHQIPYLTWHKHPGYHMNGSCTPGFLKTLSQYKVAICTSSVYGYALRKIIEATAAGCIVITDLPCEDILPHIDGNLTRIKSEATPREVAFAIRCAINRYNPELQAYTAQQCQLWYNWQASGIRLANAIEYMRRSYPCSEPQSSPLATSSVST